MDSAVDFQGTSRVHIALTVSDLDASVAFYAALFQTEPTKHRPGYAKFEASEPSVNLALNEDRDAVRPPAAHSHFGIQLKSLETLASETERLRSAGVMAKIEDKVTCCYAVQDKTWVRDPDGHAWEVFVVTESDAPVHSRPKTTGDSACCTETSGASCCA